MNKWILKTIFNRHGFLFPMMILATLLAGNVSPVGGLAQAAVSGLVAGSDTSTIRNPNVPVGDNSVLSAYTKPNQSRIWYNSHKKRWDALVPKNDGGSSDHYIMKDVSGEQTFTDIELEDRDFARPDCFWDDANTKLYVIGSHASNITPSRTEFWRVNFDEVTDSYSIEVGAPGVGVSVPGITHPETNIGGNSPATLYVSPNGDVWVAVMKDNSGLEIQHSADGGATWMAQPITLDDSAKLGVTTWIHFEDQGNTYVGVFAGENGEGGMNTDFFFWFIDQNADPSVLANWENDSPNIPDPFGVENSDDHVSATRDADGNQYFAVKTEGGNPTDPLIKLYKRTPNGVWSQFKVTETQEVPEESRPSMVIDEENVEIYIYTNGAEVVSDIFRNGVRVKAGLNSLEDLASAKFVTLFDGAASGKIFTDIISPRHPVNSESGLVVLAHNRTNEKVWFSAEDIDVAPDDVPVPDVTGLSQAAAEAAIVAAGLTVGTVTTANSDTVPVGDVISQNPTVGTSVAPDSPIDLVISLGPALVCDFIPGTYPLSSSQEINIEKNGVTVNGNSVSKGKWKGDSVVESDGTRDFVSQRLPDLDPAEFPANSSKTDISDLRGTVNSSIPWFRKKVTIKKNNSGGFVGGGPFHIDELKLEENATVNLAAGTYFVNKLKMDKKNATLNVTSESVVLHIGKEAKLAGKYLTVNPGGTVTGLQVFLHIDATFKGGEELDFTGLIYGPDNKAVELKKDAIFRGAIITSGKIKIKEDVSIIYSAGDQAAVSKVIINCNDR